MLSCVPVYPIPLSSRPIIQHITFGVHGPSKGDRFIMPNHWCIQLYTYSAEFHVGDSRIDVHPGYASVTPPATEWRFVYPARSMHLVAHFIFPEDAVIDRTIPVMQDLGDDFGRIYQEFTRAMHIWFADPMSADVCLWNILLEMTSPHAHAISLTHQQLLVQKAQTRIEDRLAGEISIASIANELGVSHNHLTRLFKAGTGATVVAYIRKRRAIRARLLLETTNLPMNLIAANIGMEDQRYFSRLIRSELGNTPTEIRRKAQSGKSICPPL